MIGGRVASQGSLFVHHTGMIVLNCGKLVRMVPAIKFVPHGGITLHSINRGSISLRALKSKNFLISAVDELWLLQKGSLKLERKYST